jgi:SPX domain protein involved in polyphosphate accumulation
MNDQMIFKRYELKYLLSKEQRMMVEQAMADHMTADVHGHSTILSLYLDTPDYRLVRRSIEKPFYKEKLRLRSYGVADPDTTVFVELKKKCDSIVYKRRIGMTEQETADYLLSHHTSADSQISREISYCLQHYEHLAPKVLLSYERDAFYGDGDPSFRITFDENILWRDYDTDLTSGVYGTPILDEGQSLMEVKTAGAIPLWLVHVLSENRIYRTSFSKYGSAYCMMLRTGSQPIPMPAADADYEYQKEGKYHYA